MFMISMNWTQEKPMAFYNALRHNDVKVVTEMLANDEIDANMQFIVHKTNYNYLAAGKLESCLTWIYWFHVSEQASAIDVATFFQCMDCIKVLLWNGATVNHGLRPLLTACKHDFVDALRLLLSHGADPNVEDALNGNTVVHWCAVMASNKCLQVLLKSPMVIHCYHDNTPLHTWASSCETDEHAELETLKLLLQHGFDVDGVNKEGVTPLMFSVSIDLARKAKALIEHGATANVVDNIGQTSLHHACHSGASKCIKLLIPRTTAINTVNGRGQTVLDLALKHIYSFGGSEPNVTNFDAKVAISCLKLLLSHGGVPKEFTNPLHLQQVLREYPATIDAYTLFFNSVSYFNTHRIISTIFEDVEMLSQQQKGVLSILQLLAVGPRSLRHLSRCAVRRCLGRRIHRDTAKLPLPPNIKMYISLDGTQEIN
ncbi:uncharacterized protein LOC144451812 [Glandiceps talaboti]